MLQDAHAFSGFSVKNKQEAKDFYADTLGLTVDENEMGLMLLLNDGNKIFIYQKDDHQPSNYTILNFAVADIDETVKKLAEKNVMLEKYEFAHQDEKGIARGLSVHMGPDIAWFKDPSGNTLAVLQEK